MDGEPFKSEVMAKIREYQSQYDPEKVYLRENRSTIRSMYGHGICNAFHFMTAVAKSHKN